MINNKNIDLQFEKYLEDYRRNSNSKKASEFLYKHFCAIIYTFIFHYIQTWGAYIPKEDIEDLTQILIIKYFDILKKQKIVTYKEAQAYLKKMVKHKLIDFFRKKYNQSIEIDDENQFPPIIPSFEITGDYSVDEIFILIKPFWNKALEKSSNHTRAIIKSLMKDIPHYKISQNLGIEKYQPHKFKTMKYQAKRTFQKFLLYELKKALSNNSFAPPESEIIRSLIQSIEKVLPQKFK